MCPKGDDPLTIASAYRTISFTTSAKSGTLSGSIKFSFNGETLYIPADASAFTSDLCTASFKSMQGISDASCTRSAVDANLGATYTLAIKSYPSNTYENNIFYHSGNPNLNVFMCNMRLVIAANTATGVTCITRDIVNNGNLLAEHIYCSNRGVCDFGSGKCNCYNGFSNSNCDTYQYGIRSLSSNLAYDVVNVITTTPSYTGSLLHLFSMNAGDSTFNFITVKDASKTLLTMKGDGSIYVYYGTFNLRKGLLSIYTGGLVVTGGFTVAYDGLLLATPAAGKPGSDGTNTLYVNSGGMVVTGGMTVNSGDVYVQDGGMKFPGGLTLATGGLIKSGGLGITGGLTVLVLGQRVAAGGMSIQNAGIQLTGGVTVYSGGLFTQNGGLTIPVASLVVTGGATVQSSGLIVTGGLTVSVGGLYVDSPQGVTTMNSGIKITGGVTVNSLGLMITGGLSVQSGGDIYVIY